MNLRLTYSSELSIEGSGLQYQPGDSLAVVVENPPQLVQQILRTLDLDPETVVPVAGMQKTIAEVLRKDLEITIVNLGFLRAWSGFSAADELAQLFEPGQETKLSEFIDSHQVIDVVTKYPAHVDAETFAGSLRRLSPRSYSIASSQTANPDEVHLTVAAVRYEAFGSDHWGAASTHLADRVDEGEAVSVYVEENTRFRLPADDKPIIMIGPGTGVAPFRAFIEERAERGASGDNWLIFGDRNFSSDFLYQLEWQRHIKQGHLQRLDVAFSRDQHDKVYVQQRIRENAAEIYDWLQRGAVIYVCGDAKHMVLSRVVSFHLLIVCCNCPSGCRQIWSIDRLWNRAAAASSRTRLPPHTEHSTSSTRCSSFARSAGESRAASSKAG